MPDCIVLGIEENIERVVINLLDKAIKHYPPNSDIFIRMMKGTEKVTVEIEDTSEGIKKEHLPHIFDRFYRVSSKVRPQNKGHGLGLSLCKTIIQDDKGQISVTSQIDKGSKFSFILPLAK